MEYAGTAHEKKFDGSNVRPLKQYKDSHERGIDKRRQSPIEPHESEAAVASALGEKVPGSVDEGCGENKG